MDPGPRDYRFKPSHRLKGRSEFGRLFSRGKKTTGNHFLLYVMLEDGEKRIGFSIKRKIGNAPVRNRIKRWARELFRMNQECLRPSSQVIVAKPGAGPLSRREFDREILELWDKAGIWKDPPSGTSMTQETAGKKKGLLQKNAQGLFFAYKKIVSPVLQAMFGRGCRFYPSCSSYAKQALERHGILRGGILLFWRLMKCNPWHAGGLDPVPGDRKK